MEREIQFNANPKKEIEAMLDELAHKGEHKTRGEILKSIKKQDEELAQMERRLMDLTTSLVVMTIGALTRYVTARMINKYM